MLASGLSRSALVTFCRVEIGRTLLHALFGLHHEAAQTLAYGVFDRRFPLQRARLREENLWLWLQRMRRPVTQPRLARLDTDVRPEPPFLQAYTDELICVSDEFNTNDNVENVNSAEYVRCRICEAAAGVSTDADRAASSSSSA